MNGWLEIGEEPKSTILKVCPNCGKKLSKVDSSRLCGIIFVYCPNSQCRYAEEFTA